MYEGQGEICARGISIWDVKTGITCSIYYTDVMWAKYPRKLRRVHNNFIKLDL